MSEESAHTVGIPTKVTVESSTLNEMSRFVAELHQLAWRETEALRRLIEGLARPKYPDFEIQQGDVLVVYPSHPLGVLVGRVDWVKTSEYLPPDVIVVWRNVNRFMIPVPREQQYFRHYVQRHTDR